jgi:glycine cleavage system H protein
MIIPENFHFTKDHEWINIKGSEALVGITDYAQSELGDIIYSEFAQVGEQRDAAAAFGTIEAVKAVSEVFMPVSGEILEVNAQLADKPELINEDPYEAGWMIRIKLLNPSEVTHLMDAAAYTTFIQ